MSDRETQQLLRGIIAQGGLPLEVILKSLSAYNWHELCLLREELRLEMGTHNNWLTHNNRKIKIRNLSNTHLYNILHGFGHGRWKTVPGGPIQGAKKMFLAYEFRKRGFEPYIEIIEFESANKEWENKQKSSGPDSR